VVAAFTQKPRRPRKKKSKNQPFHFHHINLANPHCPLIFVLRPGSQTPRSQFSQQLAATTVTTIKDTFKF
jgi:hypothetical protein